MNIKIRIRKYLYTIYLIFLIFFNTLLNINSQEINFNDNDISDILEGFGDDDFENNTFEDENQKYDFIANKKKLINIFGSIKLASSFNFSQKAPDKGASDWRGLSSLRYEFFLEWKKKINNNWNFYISAVDETDMVFLVKGRNNYSKKILDNQEKVIDLKQAYIEGKLLKKLDIKLGKQIVVWGRSDNIRVVDVLNPLDLEEPGMTDIEDIRESLFMTRLDYYIKNFNISAAAIHEIEFNKNPQFGSPYYPIKTQLPKEYIPSESINNTEIGISINAIFNSFDISFYYANIYDDNPYYSLKPEIEAILPLLKQQLTLCSAPLISPDITNIADFFEAKHSKLNMFGFAFNKTYGNWLIKSEAAFFQNIKFLNIFDKSYKRIDTLFGIEYSGFDETLICIETLNKHILNYDKYDNLLKIILNNLMENEFQSSFRIDRDFFHDSLKLSFVSLFMGESGNYGSLYRLSASYDINDPLNFTAGIIIYESYNNLKYDYLDKNDRIFFEFKYSF